MTPTREQIEAARAKLKRLADASCFSRETADAIYDLLAATADPTEEELEAEAEAWYESASVAPNVQPWDAYIAGARREGRNR